MNAIKDQEVHYSSIMSFGEKIHVEQTPLGNFLTHLS
jgi:hypothetical protein